MAAPFLMLGESWQNAEICRCAFILRRFFGVVFISFYFILVSVFSIYEDKTFLPVSGLWFSV